MDFYRNESFFMLLESNSNQNPSAINDAIVAVGRRDHFQSKYHGAWDGLRKFHQKSRDWVFGYLGYDLKNDLEDLNSNNPDFCHFPDILFFVPEHVFRFCESVVEVHTFSNRNETADLVAEIQHSKSVTSVRHDSNQGKLIPVDSRSDYVQKVERCLQHIHRGDIYEVNFCTAFRASGIKIDTNSLFQDLNQISSPPFAGLARMGSYNLISASPERYIRKIGDRVISQPIKGTARRESDPQSDAELIEHLKNDPKEQSENIMIVDLVRNDLSRTAEKGSVRVSELMEIYTFKQVHQMISTVESRLDDDYDIIDLLRTTFPMGSMTGAPKISAMQIADESESFKRGPYSGAMGYITPDGDCDFNVLIRSVFYNQATCELMLGIGSAITAQADPQYEFEECMLKARALIQTLKKQGIHLDQ
jgi:para-aminobenzoate synthetase component 1